MPTYEYVCTSCQNQWEEIQKISEAPLETCPKCSNRTAKRQISGGNFILKGGGWYADLYSSSSKSSSKSDSSPSSANSSDSSSSSSDSGSSSTSTNGDGGSSSSSKSETKAAS